MVVRKVKEMEDEVEDVDVDVVEAVRQVVEVTVEFLDTLEPIPQLMTVHGGGVKSFVKVVAIKIAGEMVLVVVELNNLYKVMPVCVC